MKNTMATMSRESLYSKYAKEVFTVNISFIDTFVVFNHLTNPCAEVVLPTYAPVVPGPAFLLGNSPFTFPSGPGPILPPLKQSYQRSIRSRGPGHGFTTTVELIQRKVTLADMEHGCKLATKIPYILMSKGDTRFFMTLALSAIWHEAKNREHFWTGENKIMKDSTIHFEIFDEHDNLVYAPLDLLHPISMDYESGRFGFIKNHKQEYTMKFEDEHGIFTLLKRPNRYGSVEEYIVSSLDIFTARSSTDLMVLEVQIDRETLRSIYAGLPTNEVCSRDMFISRKWENNLIHFVDINN